jgi:hypothetical protein
MGQAISWMGIRGLSREEICKRLDAVDTGNPCDEHEAKLALAELANGWTIIRSKQFDYPSPKRLKTLSQSAEVIAGQIEEHVMVSLARGFRDGAQIWSVIHDPAKGLYNLAIEGEPPAELAQIYERLQREQDEDGGDSADVDFIIDVAPKLIAVLCGYQPNEPPFPAFTALQPVPRGFSSIIAGMFGRR